MYFCKDPHRSEYEILPHRGRWIYQCHAEVRHFSPYDIQPDLACQKSGQLSNLDGMLQRILSIACSEFHTSKQTDQFRMDSLYTNLDGCCSPLLADHVSTSFWASPPSLQFLPDGYVHPRSSVQEQYGQLLFGSDQIRINNCLRCIINDQALHLSGLKSSDIPSLSSDDPSFHLITWKLYDGNRSLRHMVGCTFLNCVDDIFFRFFVCFFLCLCFQLSYHLGCFMLHIVFNSFQQIFFCLFGGKT